MTAELVDRVYEASFVPERWPDILLDLARLSESKGGLLLSTREKTLNWTASDNIYDAFADYLQGGWFRRCGRRVCLLEQAHSAFLTELDYWTEEELAKNEIYQQFFYPRNLGWSAGTGLVMPTGDHIVFSIERTRERGPLEETYVNILNEIRPHIARAAMVAARMGLKQATSARDAFEKMSIPTILLNSDGVSIECSDDADALSATLYWDARNRLILRDEDANRLLKNALRQLGDREGVQSFAIKNDDLQPTHVGHVIPISRSAHDLFAKGYALLILNPVGARALPGIDLLRSLFDLTAAEARVARELGGGATVEAIAKKGGVSINTVRSQVRRIIEKTGCGRQPELVSLIANLVLTQKNT